MTPPLVMLNRPVVVTCTWPALPLEIGSAALAISDGGDAKLWMLSDPAVTVTSPAFPAVKVSDSIEPPPIRVAAPATLTDTVPAEPPVCSPFWLTAPVSLEMAAPWSPPPSMYNEPTVTVTWPALALALPLLSLETLVKYCELPAIKLNEPAVTFTSPALLAENVLEVMYPPLATVATPLTAPVTVPAAPPCVA